MNTMVSESVQFRIGKSAIDGNGVFAKHPFVAGESIGTAFSFARTFSPCMHADVDREISRTILGRYVNHSLDPNCSIHESAYRRSCALEYVALKNIDVGEEITVDYRTIQWTGKRDFVNFSR